MPQRHSRNNNDLGWFTYEEKRKLGFGTQKERLGKDSIKPFDACCLCLKPLIDPVCCRKGHLFCKECIYSSLLAQKKDIKRKLNIYAAQEKDDKEDMAEALLAERDRQLEVFEQQNNSAVPSQDRQHGSGREASGGFHGAKSVKTTAFEAEALRTMKAYWLPSATPDAPTRVEAPTMDTVCPQGDEKLRLKDLFPVAFTCIRGKEDMDVQTGGGRFMCPSCSTTFTNASTLTAVSSCGHVLCKKCAEKFVSVEKACVICSKKCKEKDLVELEKGGTGYAGHGENLSAVAFKHLGSGSGAAKLRPVTRLQ